MVDCFFSLFLRKGVANVIIAVFSKKKGLCQSLQSSVFCQKNCFSKQSSSCFPLFKIELFPFLGSKCVQSLFLFCFQLLLKNSPKHSSFLWSKSPKSLPMYWLPVAVFDPGPEKQVGVVISKAVWNGRVMDNKTISKWWPLKRNWSSLPQEAKRPIYSEKYWKKMYFDAEVLFPNRQFLSGRKDSLEYVKKMNSWIDSKRVDLVARSAFQTFLTVWAGNCYQSLVVSSPKFHKSSFWVLDFHANQGFRKFPLHKTTQWNRFQSILWIMW